VRSEDPSLSPEANRALTEELRQAVGSDEVEVPADAPRRSVERHGTHSPFVATLIGNRAIILVTLLVALVVGGIIALSAGTYWALLIAVGVHALGTMLVTAGAVQLTTEVEHVSPETAARLEGEGVADPDRLLSNLVEDHAGAREAGGVPEVVSPGHNDRTVAPEDSPARAAVEQRSALTPQSRPGGSAGEGSAVEALPWWTVLGVMVASVVAVPATSKGWAIPLIIVPLGLAWMGMQWWMKRRRTSSDRAQGDVESAHRRLAPVTVFVVFAVLWFMVVARWLMT